MAAVEAESTQDNVYASFSHDDWITYICDVNNDLPFGYGDVNTYKAVRAKAFILMFGTDIEEIRGKGVKGGTLTDIESILKMNLSNDELREQVITWVSQMIAFYNGQSPTRS